jgi:hypothetical protein
MHGTMNLKEMVFSPNLEKDPFCSRNCSILLFQVSCLWQGQYLLTVSLSGFINYLDVNNPDKHIRIIKVIITACFAIIPQVANFTGTVVTTPRASRGSLEIISFFFHDKSCYLYVE